METIGMILVAVLAIAYFVYAWRATPNRRFGLVSVGLALACALGMFLSEPGSEVFIILALMIPYVGVIAGLIYGSHYGRLGKVS